jgi:glyoxalase family protein
MHASAGIHHVTAIAGDPQRNADFYVDALGLRFVKRTVNHDDTGTYHFYFGDGEGTPGTTMTFFPWTDEGRQGAFGAGQTRDTAFVVAPDSVDYWADRLEGRDVAFERTERFGDAVLSFSDPDGIGIELVADGDAATDTPAVAWAESPVPDQHQLRGFQGVTLAVPSVEPTGGVLADVLGFEHEATEGDRHRYRATGDGPEQGSVVDIVETDAARGEMGVGTVHHVAFKTRDTDTQAEIRGAFRERGLRVSEIIDRTYFHAIYCREPGGVLFEVSTMGPGFTADEDAAELGSQLTLPGWLEDEREAIEAKLPAFDPAAVGAR